MTPHERAQAREALQEGERMLREVRAQLGLRVRELGLWAVLSLAMVAISGCIVTMYWQRAFDGSVAWGLLVALNTGSGVWCAHKLVGEVSQWVQMWALQRRMRRWLAEVREAL